MNFAKLRRAFFACFRPPFTGLPLFVWFFFAACFLIHPDSNILHGTFVDADDYTLLTHTLDWLKGQSWFDIVQHRMNPPEGVPLHFSRLNELPLAGFIMAFRAMGLGWIDAATLTAAFWPLLLFAGLLAALRELAESFLPRDWTRAIAYVTLFAAPLTLQFMPGRVDHHGLALLLTTLAYVCTLRMFENPDAVKWGFGAGLFLALGQAIALETLPWLLAMSAWVGLWMMVKGRPVARTGLVFGLTLYLASALFLMVTAHPSQWLEPDLLAYSVVYVLLAGEIAVCLAAVALVAQTRFVALRYAAGIVAAGVAAILFFARFPELLSGPYGALDKALRSTMFGHIAEMLPVAADPRSLTIILLIFAGLFTSIGLFPKPSDKDRWPKWTLSFLLLITAFLLTACYQVRFATYTVLFSLVPLTLFLQRSLAWAGKQNRGRKLVAIELGLILLVGPLLSVLLPALRDGRPFNTGVVLFPVQAADHKCDNRTLAATLNDPALVGGEPRLIINSVNEGAALLFRTPHKILAAPYHTNVSGNLDADLFFSSQDPAEAKKIACAHKAELVVMCRELPYLYKSTGAPATGDDAGKEDNDDCRFPLKPNATFAEQLKAGKVPAWLEPVDIPRSSHALVFKVKSD